MCFLHSAREGKRIRKEKFGGVRNFPFGIFRGGMGKDGMRRREGEGRGNNGSALAKNTRAWPVLVG